MNFLSFWTVLQTRRKVQAGGIRLIGGRETKRCALEIGCLKRSLLQRLGLTEPG